MVAQPVIQNIGYRTDEDVEQRLEESDEGSEEVADCYLMLPCAVGLRNDLSEHHNRNGRDNDRKVTWHNLVQEDGQSLQRE